MASDSRVTFNNTTEDGGVKTVNVGASISDAIYKTFSAANRLGLSYCGDATLRGMPLAGYVDTFIRDHIEARNIALQDVPQALIDYFRSFDPIPDTFFHVAGYQVANNIPAQNIWRIGIRQPFIQQVAPALQSQGVLWNGEMDISTANRRLTRGMRDRPCRLTLAAKD